MDTRLKQRLTGAAILVALIVLLVPEMFHGQRGDIESGPSTGAEGPPLRSYTIDLSNGASRTAPLQSTPAAIAPQPSNPGTDRNDSEAAEPVPARSEPTTVATGAISRAERAPPAHSATSGWSVQLGMFAQRENAERLLHAAQTKGFAVTLADADGKGLYRVRAAGLPDRAAAQALQQRLRADGFAAALVPPPAPLPNGP